VTTHTVTVRAGGGSYPVLVGSGVRRRLPEVLGEVRRVAVVTQAAIGFEVDPGCEHEVFTIGEGEEAKTLATVEELCRAWARWGLTRADRVVAVGGGLVTDVAGFAAAVYHRGVGVVHVPTTLLGMVDAAIGGKTGVNLPEGKNLVGAFWQPGAVLCDLDALATLPERERRSGLGEMAKYHFLTGRDLTALPLDERVAACVRIKAEVVAADERERVGGPGGAGRSSTTATRSPTRWRPPGATTCATARPSPSASSTPPSSPAGSGGSTTPASPTTVGWSRATACRPPHPPASTPTS
jgi:5-deoxy-5-amino-3-dehydroquinate synthase